MKLRRSWLGLAFVIAAAFLGVAVSSGAAGGPCSPSTPQYCPPPHVQTGPAKQVTSKSATLTGTVNPNGSSTSCHFEYGRTRAYGSNTAVRHVGSGSRNVSVSAAVAGLAAKTVYHYQLVCRNLGHAGTGGDRHFRTLGPAKRAPVVHTSRIRGRNIRRTSATLLGTVNPNGSRTTCRFQYGRTEVYGKSTPAFSAGSGTTTRQVRVRVRGLSARTTYHYQLVCRSLGGTRKGGDQRFTTRKRR